MGEMEITSETREKLFSSDSSLDLQVEMSLCGMIPIKRGAERMMEVWETLFLNGVKVENKFLIFL